MSGGGGLPARCWNLLDQGLKSECSPDAYQLTPIGASSIIPMAQPILCFRHGVNIRGLIPANLLRVGQGN